MTIPVPAVECLVPQRLPPLHPGSRFFAADHQILWANRLGYFDIVLRSGWLRVSDTFRKIKPGYYTEGSP